MPIKNYVVEDGVMYYPKKPIYKHLLFWTTLLGFLMNFVFGISILLLSAHHSLTFPEPSPSVESSYDGYRKFQVGQTVDFQDGLRVAVKDIAKDRNLQLIDDPVGQAVVVLVELENTGRSTIYVNEMDFMLIQEESDALLFLNPATYEVDLPEKIKAGERLELRLIYASFAEESPDSFLFLYDDVAWQTFHTEDL